MDRNFLASCQTHDACYSISNRDKNECDKHFKENLEVLCEKENIAFCDAIIWAAGYATGHKGQLKISEWSISYGHKILVISYYTSYGPYDMNHII